jgi:hypothetical protein
MLQACFVFSMCIRHNDFQFVFFLLAKTEAMHMLRFMGNIFVLFVHIGCPSCGLDSKQNRRILIVMACDFFLVHHGDRRFTCTVFQ